MNPPRSYLFVPGTRPERFGKALLSGADVVVLDLEDAVAADTKAAARDAIADWLPTVGERQRVLVRINLETAVPPGESCGKPALAR